MTTSNSIDIIDIPNSARNATKVASLLPLYVLWFSLIVALPVGIVWGNIASQTWGITEIEAKLAMGAIGFALPLASVALTIILKYALSEIAAYITEKFLAEEGVEDAIRMGIKKQIRHKFWFDSITRTVPTAYRRMVIVGNSKSKVNPFCVMDVGPDFRTITLEHYQPGEVVYPPLTRSSDLFDNYKYLNEWSRGLTKPRQR